MDKCCNCKCKGKCGAKAAWMVPGGSGMLRKGPCVSVFCKERYKSELLQHYSKCLGGVL